MCISFTKKLVLKARVFLASAAIFSMAGCVYESAQEPISAAATVRGVVSEVALGTGDPSARSSKRHEVVLYYVTNREHRGVTDPDKFFGNRAHSPASEVHYGRYPVSTDAYGEKFLPGNLRITGKALWFQEVRELAMTPGGAPKRDILIYVHGYNNGFTDAARACARLYSGFEDRVVPVFYSWPSSKSIRGYMADENETEKSAEYFAEFLNELAKGIPEARIAIVAHSMGSRVVLEGLERFNANYPSSEGSALKLWTVALFAADIDKNTYGARYSKTVNKSATRVLVYVSARDKALAASGELHGAHPRLGQTHPEPYTDDKSETIDATDAGHDVLGHGYLAGNRAVITDLGYAIAEGIPGWRRPGLRAGPNRIATKYYWLIVN